MKLMTKVLEKSLPALYSQEEVEDPIVRAHFFNPAGQGDWWITEGSHEGDDYIMFGLCYIFEPELGYVSLNELQATKVHMAFGVMGIERDLHWAKVPLSEVQRKYVREAS
jgi:hypothetical protein